MNWKVSIKKKVVIAINAVLLINAVFLGGAIMPQKVEASIATLENSAGVHTTGSVWLNEFMSDPSTGSEWVELENTTSEVVDLSTWSLNHLSDPTDLLTETPIGVTLSGTIPAGGVKVIVLPAGSLGDSGDAIVLYNGATLKDFVFYGVVDADGSGLIDAPDAALTNIAAPGSGESGSYNATSFIWEIDTTPTKGWHNDGSGVPSWGTVLAGITAAGLTTNLDATVDPSNLASLFFEVDTKGRIDFSPTSSAINITGLATLSTLSDIASNLVIDLGTVQFDPAVGDFLKNNPAQITMEGMTFESAPTVFINGVPLSLESDQFIFDGLTNTLTFDVSHFSTYTVGSTVAVATNTALTDNTPKITGTVAHADDIVSNITIGVATYPIVQTGLTWESQVTTALADGTYNVIVDGTDVMTNPLYKTTANEIAIDTTAPGKITNLTATPGNNSVVLNWANPTDTDFMGVRIFRDGVEITTALTTATTYTDTTAVNGTTYVYDVYAYDEAGNKSEKASVSATPVAPVVTPAATTTVIPAVATTVTYPEITLPADEVKEEIKSATDEIKPAEEEKKDVEVKDEKKFPVWGIVLLLILAGFGGYLFYVQKPEAPVASSKKKSTLKKKK